MVGDASSGDLLRLNAICPYYTMFPLDFPLGVLASAPPTARVLDPFCGRGTTGFAARLHGLTSTGIDSNPVAVAIAQAKHATASVAQVVDRCDELLGAGAVGALPDGEFWSLCYHPETLLEICTLRGVLLDAAAPVDIVLRALLLGILHGPHNKGQPTYLSNQMPRTYATKPAGAIRYWTARQLTPPRVSVRQVVERRARHVLAALPPDVEGNAILGDSRTVELAPATFSHVITSPPYPGMRTYYPDQWLRAWFLGGPERPTQSGVAQIASGSGDTFLQNLATVWSRVAGWCVPGAALAVRFGAIPCASSEPTTVLTESLSRAEAGWVVREIRSAGLSPRGRRQADQFGEALGPRIEEIDVLAELRA